MKKLRSMVVMLACITQILNTTAQPHKTDSVPSKKALAPAYLGIGTGVNNYTGIFGVGVDVRIEGTLFFRAGVGIGTWGYKFTGALRYDFGYTSGFAFELGYSYCTGLNNFNTSLPTDSAGYTTTKSVAINLLPATSLNFAISYNWVFHNGNQFYINTGYAIPLITNPYQVTDGSILTATSKYTLSILEPGGIILSCGFMFAL